MFYYAPFDADLMLPAPAILRWIATCEVLGLPPGHTTPAAFQEAAVSGDADKIEAAVQKLLAQWEAMTAWRPQVPCSTGPVLRAMQSRLYEYLFLLGGRAGGKSHEVAEAVIELASFKRERVVCGREFMASIKDSNHALLSKKIKESRHAADWTITDQELRHKNGSLITFMGMARNPDSAKSLEGCTIFWGEESQSLSATSLEILTPTIREHGSMLVFTFNTRFTDDPVPRMALVPSERPEASWIKVVQFEDNPHFFRSRLFNDMRKSFRQSKRFKHVWRGDYDRNSELQILSYVTGRPPVTDHYAMHGRDLYGIDFGGSDPTALVRCVFYPPEALGRDQDERGALHFVAEFAAPCRSNRDIVDAVKAVCPELLEGHQHLKADSADPKAIGELNNAGIPTQGVEKGPGSVLAGLRALADLDLYVSPDCPQTANAFDNYRWKPDRAGKPTNVPEHTFSHIPDAARYAIEGERLDGQSGVAYLILGELTDVQ